MASAPFLSLNAGRRYPLVDVGTAATMLYSGGGEQPLPDDAILDITVILGLGADFDAENHRVYLYEVSRNGNTLDFTFRFDSPNLSNHTLTFCRRIDDAEFAVSYATTQHEASSSIAELICDGIITEGWLTTGKLANLAAILADGEWLRRGDGQVYVEPARIQAMDGQFVRTINVANADRTRVTGPDCVPGEPYATEGSSEAASTRTYIANALCLQGNLRFREGFNCVIIQDTLNNQLTIGAGVGSGLGEPCAEVPLYEGEGPPEDSVLLSGGPACHEIVKTINGLPGPHINITGGRGVRVEPDETNPHKLVVRIDFHGIAVCEED